MNFNSGVHNTGRQVSRPSKICTLVHNISVIIDIANAVTPPGLFGIDRRIAYANMKYHSG